MAGNVRIIWVQRIVEDIILNVLVVGGEGLFYAVVVGTNGEVGSKVSSNLLILGG